MTTTATDELCGAPTELGPCNMKVGHAVSYHRHRVYETIEWEIKNGAKKVLKRGTARVPLQYAINDALDQAEVITITVKRVSGNPGAAA